MEVELCCTSVYVTKTVKILRIKQTEVKQLGENWNEIQDICCRREDKLRNM
jgi:hypothetical protein